MLADPAAVRAVAYGEEGLLAGMGGGSLWIDLSTVAPADSREFAAAAGERGVRMLDAPVSGSLGAAERGMLVVLAGGTEGDVAAARPVLDVLGRATVHLGPSGAGSAGKLAANAFLLAAMAAAVEAVRLGESEGVESVGAPRGPVPHRDPAGLGGRQAGATPGGRPAPRLLAGARRQGPAAHGGDG